MRRTIIILCLFILGCKPVEPEVVEVATSPKVRPRAHVTDELMNAPISHVTVESMPVPSNNEALDAASKMVDISSDARVEIAESVMAQLMFKYGDKNWSPVEIEYVDGEKYYISGTGDGVSYAGEVFARKSPGAVKIQIGVMSFSE